MDDFIVPGRARPIVAAVDAGHVRVAGQKPGVAVDSADALGGLPRRLALGDHAVGHLAFLDQVDLDGNIHQYPMVEIDARQVRGECLAFLIDVVRHARHIGIGH